MKTEFVKLERYWRCFLYDPETSCGIRWLQSEVWYGRQSFV